MSDPNVLQTTKNSLQRIQDFDVQKLARTEDFGKQMNFADAVPYAERLLKVYKGVPLSILDDLTDGQLNQIRNQADADYSRFDQIMKFDNSGTSGQRSALIDSIKASYDSTFGVLFPFIAYGVARVTDSSLLESQARATMQQIKDEAEKLNEALGKNKTEADSIMENIRKTAAEQGVSQQAHYFKSQADTHRTDAETWAGKVFNYSLGLVGFALLTLGFYKVSWLKPADMYEAINLTTSKIFVFAVLGYMLLLTAKVYISHRHNEVVNRHRQNALLTFKALVDSAKEDGARDIVLAHAASCIFSPQETGYTKPAGGEATNSKSVLELLTKAAPKESHS